MKKYLTVLPMLLMTCTTFAATCHDDISEMQTEILINRSIATIDHYHFLKVDNEYGDQYVCYADAYQMYKNTQHLRYFCKATWSTGNWRNTIMCKQATQNN